MDTKLYKIQYRTKDMLGIRQKKNISTFKILEKSASTESKISKRCNTRGNNVQSSEPECLPPVLSNRMADHFSLLLWRSCLNSFRVIFQSFLFLVFLMLQLEFQSKVELPSLFWISERYIFFLPLFLWFDFISVDEMRTYKHADRAAMFCDVTYVYVR